MADFPPPPPPRHGIPRQGSEPVPTNGSLVAANAADALGHFTPGAGNNHGKPKHPRFKPSVPRPSQEKGCAPLESLWGKSPPSRAKARGRASSSAS